MGIAATVLPACREFENHRASLESLYAAGRYDTAAAMLDDPKTQDLYGSRNELLWKLDRGAVAMAMGDDDKCIEVLNQAEAQIELQREKSFGDSVSQWLLNDTAARYTAEPYEDTYVNVIKLLAQLNAGRLEGGATVEARRAASKADQLRDAYLKYDDSVEKKSGKRASGGAGGLIATNNAGEFLESPLATFLTAVTFMKTGDSEFQRVAGKRLLSSIELQKGLIGPVNEDDFKGLDELSPDAVNVLVVALSGRGPTKYAQRVGPIPLGTLPVYFELPYLRTHPSEVASARVEIEGLPPQATDRLKLVEDLNAVATENHRRQLPMIYARTLIRYSIKAGGSLAVTEGTRRRSRDRNQGLVQIAGVVGGLAFLAATEQADLRCWIFLPGQARVGLIKLEPGEHRIRTVYEGVGGGTLYSSPWRTIHVTKGGLASIVTQYWR